MDPSPALESFLVPRYIGSSIFAVSRGSEPTERLLVWKIVVRRIHPYETSTPPFSPSLIHSSSSPSAPRPRPPRGRSRSSYFRAFLWGGEADARAKFHRDTMRAPMLMNLTFSFDSRISFPPPPPPPGRSFRSLGTGTPEYEENITVSRREDLRCTPGRRLFPIISYTDSLL